MTITITTGMATITATRITPPPSIATIAESAPADGPHP